MQYSWYELLAYGVMVGLTLYVLFTGLEIILDRLLERRIRKELEEQNKEPIQVEIHEQRDDTDGA